MSTKSLVRVTRGFLGSFVEGVGFEERCDFWGVRHSRVGGDIRTFSKASAGRLRRSLCMLAPSFDCRLYGLCLTIPGAVLPPNYVRMIWHNFRVRASRLFPSLPWIWRVELQCRKQAHWHLVVYAPVENGFVCAFGLRSLWEDVIRRRLYGKYKFIDDKCFANFLRCGVRIDDLSKCSLAGVVGYLVDHATKHKQSQLGWNGRQWGIVNRSSLRSDGVEVFRCSYQEWVKIRRQYERLRRSLKREGRYYGRALSITRKGDIQNASIFGSCEERLFMVADKVLNFCK